MLGPDPTVFDGVTAETSDQMSANIHINPAAKIQACRLGAEQFPLIVIDDLIAQPETLVETAAQEDWAPPKGTFYPGINAKLPYDYVEIVHNSLRPLIARTFGIPLDIRVSVRGFFALTTLPFDQFGPIQRVPHFDNTFHDHLALVHYLAPNQTGGTGFFRHIKTGWESISHQRHDPYVHMMTEWMRHHSHELKTYAGPETPGYEMYFRVPFKFNRALIYPSNVLHCALYDGTNQSDDPLNGRLTANTFWVPLHQRPPQTRL